MFASPLVLSDHSKHSNVISTLAEEAPTAQVSLREFLLRSVGQADGKRVEATKKLLTNMASTSYLPTFFITSIEEITAMAPLNKFRGSAIVV